MIKQQILDFLGKIIISNDWIFVDNWSFIHIIFGAVIFHLLINGSGKTLVRLKKYNPMMILIIIIILFEFIEYFIYNRPNPPIDPEIPIDFIWDVVFGIIGGRFYRGFRKKVG